jgi:hypothetical protein
MNDDWEVMEKSLEWRGLCFIENRGTALRVPWVLGVAAAGLLFSPSRVSLPGVPTVVR